MLLAVRGMCKTIDSVSWHGVRRDHSSHWTIDLHPATGDEGLDDAAALLKRRCQPSMKVNMGRQRQREHGGKSHPRHRRVCIETAINGYAAFPH